MNKNKQSLKTIFAEAVGYYRKKDFKTAEVFCYKILSIDRSHFDSISLLSNICVINKNSEVNFLLLILLPYDENQLLFQIHPSRYIFFLNYYTPQHD